MFFCFFSAVTHFFCTTLLTHALASLKEERDYFVSRTVCDGFSCFFGYFVEFFSGNSTRCDALIDMCISGEYNLLNDWF